MAYSVSSPRPGTKWGVQASYDATFVAPANYINKPEVRNRIFDAYNEQMLYDFLIHSNRHVVSKNTTFRWMEHDSMFHTHTVESKSGSAGAGNPVTITLEEGTGGPQDHQASGTLSRPKKKDIVMVYTATGAFRGYVTATNKGTADAHTVTIQPVDATVDLVTATAAADKVTIISSAASDGAGMTLPTSRLPVEFYNYVQIIDTQKETDAGEAANESWVEVDGKPYFYHQLVVDGDFEQRAKIENAFIFGQRGTVTDPDTSKTAYLTGGLEWWQGQEGYDEQYSGSIGLTDLQNVCKNLDLERAPRKQLLLLGNNANIDIDEFVKGRLDNTAVDWTKMGIGSVAGRVADFGIDGFVYDNFYFMKKKFNLFNTLGITGGFSASPYPNMAFFIPWDRVRAENGEEMDTICLRYKQSDRQNRFMQFWTRDQKITNNDKFEFNYKSEVGIQFALSRHINRLYK